MDLTQVQRLAEAGERLGHPMGNRATDPQLAQAVLTGHLGRRPSIEAGGESASLTAGLRAQQPGMLRRAWDALVRRSVTPRTSRRWYLRRSEQQDQGATSQCVAYTQKHWELAVPTINRAGLPEAEMYARCKAIDRWPGEDGTSAEAMLTVCQQLGVVQSHWWWTGPQDDEAARRWLLDVGPMWVGLNIPESFFRTDDQGLVTVEGDLMYGHEMLVIGYHASRKMWELCNSWSNEWGLLGRGFVRDQDFLRMLQEGGDLIGVVEVRV